jgi:hypothetical protein
MDQGLVEWLRFWEIFMRIVLCSVLLIATSLVLAGCGVDIPPKVEVRDVASSTTYTTYEPWGKVEKGIGYQFTDIETGKRVTLTNYELKPVEGKKSVPGDSIEARAYNEARARGGK